MMDKKIKDIAEKAGFVLFTPEEDPRTPIDWSCDYEVELQEFAKLIIAECVKVCADRGAMHDSLYSAWAEDCSKRIERHFQ